MKNQFEGKTINGELVPTQEQIRNMNDDDYRFAHPFVKNSCQDCASLKAAMSWWCSNEDAIKKRGTRRAGCVFCPYWSPDWSQIPDKYKTPEYGYVPSNVEEIVTETREITVSFFKKLFSWLH